MAGTTSKGIVFPTVGDNLTPLEAVFATMASSIDDALSGYITTTNLATASEVTSGTSSTKAVSPKSLKDAGVMAGDTGWVDISGNVSAGSGFSKSPTFTCEARKVGAVVVIKMNQVLKNAGNPKLSIGVTGNVTNTVILSGIPTQFRPTVEWASINSGPSGRNNAYYVNPAGEIVLAAMSPSATQSGTVDCPTGEGFSATGTYFAV